MSMQKAEGSLNFNKLEKAEKNKTYSVEGLLLFLDDLLEYRRLYFELMTVLWIGFLGLDHENHCFILKKERLFQGILFFWRLPLQAVVWDILLFHIGWKQTSDINNFQSFCPSVAAVLPWSRKALYSANKSPWPKKVVLLFLDC